MNRRKINARLATGETMLEFLEENERRIRLLATAGPVVAESESDRYRDGLVRRILNKIEVPRALLSSSAARSFSRVVAGTASRDFLSGRQGLSAASTASGVAEIFIYGVIAAGNAGDISATDVAAWLKSITASTIRVRINSEGGNVFEGIAIFNLLIGAGVTIEVHVDGLAASIASVVAQAGDTITMARNSMMMIHRAWGVTIGNRDDHAEMVDLLDLVDGQIADLYQQRTGLPLRDIEKMMAAETWLTAQQAVDKGFATKVADAPGSSASARGQPLKGRDELAMRFRLSEAM